MSSPLFEVARTLARAAREDPFLRRLGRHCAATVYLGEADGASPGRGVYFAVDRGLLENLHDGPAHLRSYDFAIRASLEAWGKFFSPAPPPGYQDIFALARFGRAAIDGSLDPLLAHLPYFKRLLEKPRGDERIIGLLAATAGGEAPS